MELFDKKTNITEEDIERLLSVFKRIHSDNVWSKVNKHEFTTKRFEEGFVNDICACILTDNAQRRFKGNCSPVGIVVKFFSKNSVIKMNAIFRGIICSMVSENKLGPKLIYIDDECCINEYIMNCRPYSLEDDKDDNFVKNVMRLLARYHQMNVPISVTYKEFWLDGFGKFLNDFPGNEKIWNGEYLNYFDYDARLKPLRQEFETMNWKWIKYFFEDQLKIDQNNPLVFCHMDFHRLNRLVREIDLPNGVKSKEFYIIDLDSSNYFYRGFDLAAFFDSLYATEPFYERVALASDDVILKYLQEYRQECSEIIGQKYLQDPINSLDKLLCEVKYYVLNYSITIMYFSVLKFINDFKDEKNIQMLIGTHKRVILFKKLLKRFINENILQNIEVESIETVNT